MRTMKKFISIALCALVLLSVAVTAHAEGAQNIVMNTEGITMTVGTVYQLEPLIMPDGKRAEDVRYYTETTDIVSVDWETGLVTGLSLGETFVACFVDEYLVTVPVKIISGHDHIYSDWICEEVITEPGCITGGTGIFVRYCLDCGELLDREIAGIPANGVHTPGALVIGGRVEGTCTNPGYHTEMIRCSQCGELISEDVVSDGYGEHDWQPGKIIGDKNGKMIERQYTCSHCGETKTVREVNHDWHFRCSRCDWYDANKDRGGIYGFVVMMIHSITHLVQEIHYWT